MLIVNKLFSECRREKIYIFYCFVSNYKNFFVKIFFYSAFYVEPLFEFILIAFSSTTIYSFQIKFGSIHYNDNIALSEFCADFKIHWFNQEKWIRLWGGKFLANSRKKLLFFYKNQWEFPFILKDQQNISNVYFFFSLLLLSNQWKILHIRWWREIFFILQWDERDCHVILQYLICT